jgi:hypothetical protein
MRKSLKAKPATAETVNGLRKIELLGGGLDTENSGPTRELQAHRPGAIDSEALS